MLSPSLRESHGTRRLAPSAPTQPETDPARSGLGRGVAGRCGASCLPPLFDFGEPCGDIGMLRIELLSLAKGGDCFGKLPRHQTRVPVHKGLVC